MPKFRVTAYWAGQNSRNRNELVEASDACEALDWALPGQWRSGEFESADIHIYHVPDDTPME